MAGGCTEDFAHDCTIRSLTKVETYIVADTLMQKGDLVLPQRISDREVHEKVSSLSKTWAGTLRPVNSVSERKNPAAARQRGHLTLRYLDRLHLIIIQPDISTTNGVPCAHDVQKHEIPSLTAHPSSISGIKLALASYL